MRCPDGEVVEWVNRNGGGDARRWEGTGGELGYGRGEMGGEGTY